LQVIRGQMVPDLKKWAGPSGLGTLIWIGQLHRNSTSRIRIRAATESMLVYYVEPLECATRPRVNNGGNSLTRSEAGGMISPKFMDE
jgi:hypothetical protein